MSSVRAARVRVRVVVAVFVGGMAGGLARYGLSLAWPQSPGSFPWTTFAINLSGCLLIGMLMVAITQLWPSHALLRPLLGTGVLGGYTTFSAYIVEIQLLLNRGQFGTALAYLAGTALGALAAVWAGDSIARRLLPNLIGGRGR